ncbi:hypothetical protein Tco_0058145 [Tanacetum coccineum]
MGHFLKECRGPRNQESRPRNQDISKRTVNVEDTSSKAMVDFDGAGFDWSFMADEEVPTNIALMAFSDLEVHKDKTCSNTCLKSFETLKTQYDNLRIEFNKSEFDLATYKRGLASIEEQLVFYKKNEVIKGVGFDSYNIVAPPPTGFFAPPTIDLSNSGLKEFQQPEFKGYGLKANKSVSDCDEDESEVMVLKSDNVHNKPEQANQPRKVGQNPRNNRTQKLGVGFQFTKKACFVCGSFNHLIKDCDFHDKKMVQKPVVNNVKNGTGQREDRPVWNNDMRFNHQNFSNSRRNFAPKAILTKSGIKPISVVLVLK